MKANSSASASYALFTSRRLKARALNFCREGYSCLTSFIRRTATASSLAGVLSVFFTNQWSRITRRSAAVQ